jgi:hypothetical protein
MKEGEIGGACSTHVRRKIYAGFWWEELKERNSWEGLGVSGRIVLNES